MCLLLLTILNFKQLKTKLLNIFILGILLTGCTENISLDLNSSDPQIVVEATIPTGMKARVVLTKSVNFDAENKFPAVKNAIITLTDNVGHSEIMREYSPGVYFSDSIVGIIGNVYSLSIKTDDKTITSSCTIPNQVKFDSLIVTKAETFGSKMGDNSTEKGILYDVKVQFKDPASEKNYYRFVEYVNGISTGKVYAYDDRLTNGKKNEKNLRNFTLNLNEGDIITVEMQCIDKAVYDYFNSFGNVTMGSQNSSTPANPYTNLAGCTLGYFSTFTTEKKQVIIK